MNFIICGSAPGFGGVPKLMEYLEDRLDSSKYQIIYPKTYGFKNKYIRWIDSKISKKIFFNLKVKNIKNSNIILMHHQSIGLKLTEYLISNNKNVSFYIMDNSFFCIKSYNYIEGQNKECLECIGGSFENASNNKCKPFPVKYDLNKNIFFLNFLKNNYKKIKFYTLSDTNAYLVKKHFGENVFVKPIYFLTNDLQKKNQDDITTKKNKKTYDIVYHANELEAKGFIYIQELAKELKKFTILIPTTNKIINTNNNVFVKSMTWENGLKDAVINANLILTPSFWSSTPEAALLKSFLYNGSVGLIKNDFGFANDLDPQSYLHLTGNKSIDAKKIEIFLQEKKYLELRKKSQVTINNFIEKAEKSMKDFFLF